MIFSDVFEIAQVFVMASLVESRHAQPYWQVFWLEAVRRLSALKLRGLGQLSAESLINSVCGCTTTISGLVDDARIVLDVDLMLAP